MQEPMDGRSKRHDVGPDTDSVHRTIQPLQPTREQFDAYRAMFTYFNAELFGGRLPEVVLNFSRHAGSLGFFVSDRWERSDGAARTHEISLNPDTLIARDSRAVASTLVHEMVHLWQQVEGTPPRRNYHNREWADQMERVGLMPSNTGAPGGRRVGQRMTHYIIEGGAFADAFARMPVSYVLPWRSDGGQRSQPAPATPAEPANPCTLPKRKDPSKIKYMCPNCASNVWGKLGLHLVCGDCEARFQSVL